MLPNISYRAHITAVAPAHSQSAGVLPLREKPAPLRGLTTPVYRVRVGAEASLGVDTFVILPTRSKCRGRSKLRRRTPKSSRYDDNGIDSALLVKSERTDEIANGLLSLPKDIVSHVL